MLSSMFSINLGLPLNQLLWRSSPQVRYFCSFRRWPFCVWEPVSLIYGWLEKVICYNCQLLNCDIRPWRVCRDSRLGGDWLWRGAQSHLEDAAGEISSSYSVGFLVSMWWMVWNLAKNGDDMTGYLLAEHHKCWRSLHIHWGLLWWKGQSMTSTKISKKNLDPVFFKITDPCYGDSGGPLAIWRDNQWQLVGVLEVLVFGGWVDHFDFFGYYHVCVLGVLMIYLGGRCDQDMNHDHKKDKILYFHIPLSWWW